MDNIQTLEKMKKMRLFGMYEYFNNAIETGIIHDFEDVELLSHLIDAEEDARYNRRLQLLIKNANFRMIAQIESIKYSVDRNLSKSQVLNIIDFNWIEKGENIIITGYTGTGKTFLSCAIGLKACMQGFRVGYYNSNKFFYQLKYAKSCGNYLNEIKKITKNELVILDDFGLEVLDKESRMSLFEILEERTQNKSILISSQIPVENWYDVIGDKTIADAICDRLISYSQIINLKGGSMRKIKTENS